MHLDAARISNPSLIHILCRLAGAAGEALDPQFHNLGGYSLAVAGGTLYLLVPEERGCAGEREAEIERQCGLAADRR